MTKSELVLTLSEESGLLEEEARIIVDIVFEAMAEALAAGERVEVRGLCSFFVKKYKAYTGRNPKSGKSVKVKPKKVPFFKCGKGLRDAVNSQRHP